MASVSAAPSCDEKMLAFARGTGILVAARACAISDVGAVVSDAYYGLTIALEKFDPARGPSFRAFAATVIAGRVLNGIRSRDSVSERVRRVIRQADNGEGVPISVLRRALERRDACTPLRLEAHYPAKGCESQVALGATIARQEPSPCERVIAHDERLMVAQALAALPQRSQAVLRALYFEERTVREVALEYGVSTQRVSQIHMAALRQLRQLLGALAR